MASLLFLTSFCLFSILFCSKSYCVPIESIGGNYNDWQLGLKSEHSVFRYPDPFGLMEICNGIRQARHREVLCILCYGLDFSCFVPTTTTAKTTISTTTPSTTSSSTTTLTTPTTPATTPASTPATTPTTIPTKPPGENEET